MSKTVLMIIAPENFRDEELFVPRDIFKAQGWVVDTVSTQVCEASGMLGGIEAVTKTIDTIDADQYDAAVVVGGMGSPAHLWNNETLHRVLKQVNANGKVISAICLSGAVLAKAGLLTNRKATVWEMPESVQIFEQNQVTYTSKPVTIDDRFITANGPDAAEAFGNAIVEKVNTLVSA